MAKTFAVPSSIAWRQVDAEVVVLDLNTSVYYSLNETAGRLFELLAGSADLETAVARVAEDYGQDVKVVAADAKELVAGLLKDKLLRAA